MSQAEALILYLRYLKRTVSRLNNDIDALVERMFAADSHDYERCQCRACKVCRRVKQSKEVTE